MDLTGQKFGRLTVINLLSERAKNGMKIYKCLCNCGNYINVRHGNLTSGNTKSCGCFNSDCSSKRNSTHHKTHTRLYKIYYNMKTMCYNKNSTRYSDWGGRGIGVCDEWLNDFMSFYNWAINNGYNDTLTIDRIDNNKGYSPSNCRWVTNQEQSNNRRSNINITYNGKTQTMTQWAEELGINYNTLRMRHFRGWSDKEILLGRDV